MAEKFKIEVDHPACLLRLRFDGFLCQADLDRYSICVDRAYRELLALAPCHSVLIDLTDCVVQSQDAVSRLRRLVEGSPQANRIVVVCRSQLIAMQIRRVMLGREDRLTVVADLARAEEFLADDLSQGGSGEVRSNVSGIDGRCAT